MRTKLNPDGTKIRTLRIQRGWTQEQLAEIAGISSRTVQRAETSNCAAFETLRAIAGAFETDFDQLLQPETGVALESGMQIVTPEDLPRSEPEFEPIAVEQPAARTRTLFAVASFALAAGMVAGIILTSRLDRREGSYASVPKIASVNPPPIKQAYRPPQPRMDLQPANPVAGKAIAPATEALILGSMAAVIVENPGHLRSTGQAAEVSNLAELVSQDAIYQLQQSEPLYLPMESQDLLPIIAIPEAPAAWSNLPALTGDPIREEQELGAVRQAIDLATKKTGTFVTRVGTSLKRVF
jgi:transcriptional regulator with XRE-family HTH domain